MKARLLARNSKLTPAFSALLSLALALTLCLLLLPSPWKASALHGAETEKDTEGTPGQAFSEPCRLCMVSGSFQSPFFLAVFEGANDAAIDLNAVISLDGPSGEEETSWQIQQLQAALKQQPDAILLSASGGVALTEVLLEIQKAGIPVICFDSGMPELPDAISATIQTNNVRAGECAASHMAEDPVFLAKVHSIPEGETPKAAVLIGTEDAEALRSRAEGFSAKMSILSKEIGRDIQVIRTVPKTQGHRDFCDAANELLSEKNLCGIFAAEQAGAEALLTAMGGDFENAVPDPDSGKKPVRTDLRDLSIIGFDAGQLQKEAVRESVFLGSIAQDAYQMGYQAVTMAVRAAHGEFISNVHTQFEWYDRETSMSKLSWMLYD
jgi:ribose transport system substrate-binding protein